ncbi:hypothetical protein ADK97_34320 [Streptomyces sp. H021]|nr:hypothetical protein ADK97_34320 [Streptomyces sp. H021]
MGDDDLPIAVGLMSRADDTQPPDPLDLLPATAVTLQAIRRGQEDRKVRLYLGPVTAGLGVGPLLGVVGIEQTK